MDCRVRESSSAATPRSAREQHPRTCEALASDAGSTVSIESIGGWQGAELRAAYFRSTGPCPASTIQRGGDREVVVECSP